MKYVWHGHNWTNLYEWGDSKLNSAQPELHTSSPDISVLYLFEIFRWQSKLYDFYILFVGEVLVKCSRRNKQGFRVKEKITVRLGRNPEKKYLVQIVIFIAISKLAGYTWIELFDFTSIILDLINNPIAVVLCCALSPTITATAALEASKTSLQFHGN